MERNKELSDGLEESVLCMDRLQMDWYQTSGDGLNNPFRWQKDTMWASMFPDLSYQDEERTKKHKIKS